MVCVFIPFQSYHCSFRENVETEYRFIIGQWQPCSASCGSSGTQVRGVDCKQISTFSSEEGTTPKTTEAFVALELCGEDLPSQEQPCNRRDCPARWQVGNWSSCSRSCIQGQRHRNVSCQRVSATGTDDHVPSTQCTEVEPVATEICNAIPCFGVIAIGLWSWCSSRCGTGVQTRSVACEMRDPSGDFVQVDFRFCSSPRPPTERRCTRLACRPYWQVDEWQQCSKSCGRGRQVRDVTCQKPMQNGSVTLVNDSLCYDIRPEGVRVCNEIRCPAFWNVGPWGPCSKTCDWGVQLRAVECQQIASTGVLVVRPASSCIPPRPKIRQWCNVRDEVCLTYRWDSGQWGRCSQSCGLGQHNRTVNCVGVLLSGKTTQVNESKCLESKPAVVESCNAFDCPGVFRVGPWRECSVSCGSGEQHRTITSTQRNSAGLVLVAERRLCSGQPPATQRVCNAIQCPPRWKTPTFPICNEDNNVVVRTVLCKVTNASGVEVIAPDSVCIQELGPKPVQQQICSPACNRTHGEYTWFVRDWTSVRCQVFMV